MLNYYKIYHKFVEKLNNAPIFIGIELNTIPGQIEDNEGKTKKEVQFKMKHDGRADEEENSDRLQNGSTSTIISIPSKPAKRRFWCCRPKRKKDKPGKNGRSDDEEEMVIDKGNEKQREELENIDSESERSIVEFHEISATDR